ncbi:MAG: hypothetical protein ACXW4Z_19195, partial [Candidatus Binatia bacterium]
VAFGFLGGFIGQMHMNVDSYNVACHGLSLLIKFLFLLHWLEDSSRFQVQRFKVVGLRAASLAPNWRG